MPLLPKPITKKELAGDIYCLIKEHNPEDVAKYNMTFEKFEFASEMALRISLKLIQKTMIRMDKVIKSAKNSGI